uniref:Serglycin n=1 Tax=Catagonus wagneri TaxID=51154 RepID=A0A8C3YUP6_9CETA
TMQVIFQCSRLVLALAIVLILDSSVQGFPAQRARYQWVRCSPDSNSANCIDEKEKVFDLLPGESNRILPPRTDPSSIRTKNWNDVFPLSEDFSGSGSGAGSGSGSLSELEQEYQPVEENNAFYDNFRSLERNQSSDNQDLGLDGPEDDFTM